MSIATYSEQLNNLEQYITPVKQMSVQSKIFQINQRRMSIESNNSTQLSQKTTGSSSQKSKSKAASSTSSQCGNDEYDINDFIVDSTIDENYVQEIDVMPKRKIFSNNEERQQFVADYKRKIKTELCKNWVLKGTCKFGNKCSFAHGHTELKEKAHLHTYYKTKPCKQYFQTGYCAYGYRCQYLHSEINYYPEFRKFLSKLQQAKKLCVCQHNLQHKNSYKAKFESLTNAGFSEQIDVKDFLGSFQIQKKRMSTFKDVCGIAIQEDEKIQMKIFESFQNGGLKALQQFNQ